MADLALLCGISGELARKIPGATVDFFLTGGHDSRLVSGFAGNKFANVRFRTAVSEENARSRRDLKAVKRVARITHVPHVIHPFVSVEHKKSLRVTTLPE